MFRRPSVPRGEDVLREEFLAFVDRVHDRMHKPTFGEAAAEQILLLQGLDTPPAPHEGIDTPEAWPPPVAELDPADSLLRELLAEGRAERLPVGLLRRIKERLGE